MLPLQPPNRTAADDDIASYCLESHYVPLGGTPYGNLVVQLSGNAVVKFGVGVTEEEAHNQRRAYELIDSRVVRVPYVHRFFVKEGLGYIIMEHMEGRVLMPVEDTNVMTSVAHALVHLATIRSTHPGAIGGGPSRGIFWTGGEEPFLNSVKDMEIWFNRRISKRGHKLAFGDCELVLCHLDVAPRNFLLLEDGSICLVDWASSGFYPRLFEVCALQITHGREGSFVGDVLGLKELTFKEELQIKSMRQVYHNNETFCLPSTSTKHSGGPPPDD